MTALPSAFRFLSIALLVSTAAFPAQAEPAQEQPAPDDADSANKVLTEHPFRLELKGGGAFSDVKLSTGESINGYGAALSAGAHYRLRFGGMIGLQYDRFLGTSTTYQPRIAELRYSTGGQFIGGVLGAELAFAQAIIRPQVALGAGSLRQKTECVAARAGGFDPLPEELCRQYEKDDSRWRFMAAPELLLGLHWGRLYGFTEVRYYVRQDANAFGLFGGVGWMM